MPELLEKTLGSAGALAIFCLVFLWIVDLALALKIAATGAAILALLAIAGVMMLKNRRLAKTRRMQLLHHRAGRPPGD